MQLFKKIFSKKKRASKGAELKWRKCSMGTTFPSDAIVIPIGNPNDTDPRLVRTAIWDSKYILVSDLLKLDTEN